MSYFIPSSDIEFDAFLRRYCQIVNQKTSGSPPEWTHIPAARVTELNDARTDWSAAWAKLEGPHTAADVLAKSTAKKSLQAFNNQYVLYAREVSDAERRELGAHVHDTKPTTVPRPTAQPEADMIYPGRHLLKLVKIRPVGGGGDLRSDWGVRIFWGIMGPPTETDRFRLETPPVTGNDLPHSTFTHRQTHLFDFEGDSGKIVWFCLRYENEKGGEGGEGPFGPLFSVVIP